MLPLPRKRPKTAAALRRRLNWWSPLFFAGIQITYLSDDFMHCRARLRNWFNTKNTHGSQFVWGSDSFVIENSTPKKAQNARKHKHVA